MSRPWSISFPMPAMLARPTSTRLATTVRTAWQLPAKRFAPRTLFLSRITVPGLIWTSASAAASAQKLAPIQGVVSTATHFVLRKYKDKGVIYGPAIVDERGNCL